MCAKVYCDCVVEEREGEERGRKEEERGRWVLLPHDTREEVVDQEEWITPSSVVVGLVVRERRREEGGS